MTKEARRYMLGLRGESNYQRAIKQLSVGDLVILKHEPTNKHDDRAIVALDLDDRTIGYAPRDSWLQGAMIDQGLFVQARVSDVTGEGKERRGIVLEVFISDEEIISLPRQSRGGAGCVLLVASFIGISVGAITTVT